MNPSPLRRALFAAPDRPLAEQARADQEFFCFRIAQMTLGVSSENVREVIRMGSLTPLPRAPPFLLGVLGHRGEVFPVLDLLRFLGRGESRPGPRSRLFIAVSGNCFAAVVADSVLGLRRIAGAAVLPPPLGGEASSEHLLGVAQLADIDTLSIVDMSKILASARHKVTTR